MRTPIKLLAAVAVAGAVFAGVSAFTASNTLTPVGVSGYGEDTATGATISSIVTTPLSSDAALVDHVTFTSTTDVSTKTASMTLRVHTPSAVVGSPYPCLLGPWDGTSMTITCATSDHPKLSDYDTTGLTVV